MPLQPPIPSPYNWVPLSDQVLFPDWSKWISHDVPAQDGISGWFEIELEATTPIYVRGPGRQPDDVSGKKEPEFQEFYRLPNGDYAIPATTMKGMIRNVVEIITFGKIAGTSGAMSRVGDARYGVRDLSNPDRELYSGWMTTKEMPHASRPEAGWLTYDANGHKWMLTPCEFARVEQTDLQSHHTSVKSGTDPNLNEPKSVRKKYESWKAPFSCAFDLDKAKTHRSQGQDDKLQFKKAISLKSSGSGGLEGTIVFTGQPSRGKHREFIFYNAGKPLDVPEQIIDEFGFIHSAPNGTPNDEWGYWLSQLKKDPTTRIPVFYLAYDSDPEPDKASCKADAPNATLHSMGLALMYRLAYLYTIHDAVRNQSPDHLDESRLDFAETLFGTAEKSRAKRGRVQFEPLVALEAKPSEPKATILGSPKPSYYPNYMDQPAFSGDHAGRLDTKTIPTQQAGVDREVPNFSTLMTPDVKLRGWKRYPARKDDWQEWSPGLPTVNRSNESVATWFRPLCAGAKFRGRVHVHNVLPEELGALLWALTWGGNGSLRHSLGMAKSYGYGNAKVSIDATSLKNLEPNSAESGHSTKDAESYIQRFASFMEEKVNNWSQRAQIRELSAMADASRVLPSHLLRYPILTTGQNRENHFVEAKRDGVHLIAFSKLMKWYGPQPEPNEPSNPVLPPGEGPPDDSLPDGSSEPETNESTAAFPTVPCRITGQSAKGKWKAEVIGGTPLQCGLIEGNDFPPDLAKDQEYELLVTDDKTGRQWRFAFPTDLQV